MPRDSHCDHGRNCDCDDCLDLKACRKVFRQTRWVECCEVCGAHQCDTCGPEPTRPPLDIDGKIRLGGAIIGGLIFAVIGFIKGGFIGILLFGIPGAILGSLIAPWVLILGAWLLGFAVVASVIVLVCWVIGELWGIPKLG